jgi:hypothetical protein
MLTLLLANWRWVVMGALLLALGVQTGRISLLKSEHQAYKAEIERQVAENRAKAAEEASRMAHNATKALNDLQARLDAVRRSYRVLRDSRGTPAVPSLSESTGIAQSCPGEPDKPNPAVGRLAEAERGIEAILELGDREIAKYVELWKLQVENGMAAK